MLVWEIIFLVIILKIPVAYVGGLVWWATKSEPDATSEEDPGLRRRGPFRRRPPGPGRFERTSARGLARRAGRGMPTNPRKAGRAG